jgi:hypothetical protein
MNSAEGAQQTRRLLLLTIWTLIILWSMDIARPSESAWVGTIQHWFRQQGLPEYTPAKLYHCGSFFIWIILLAGTLARGYWVVLPLVVLAQSCVSLAIFASTTEVLQLFNQARHASIVDVLINISGGALGLLFQWIVARSQAAVRPSNTA